jgi:hypothetical protein
VKHFAAWLLLPLIALVVVLSIPAPAAAQSTVTVRVRSLENTAPFGNNSLVTVLIIQDFGQRLTAGSSELVGAVAPGAGNEYTLNVPLNSNYVPNQRYRVEAYIGENSSRISRYFGRINAVNISSTNANFQVTTASDRRPIPDVSAGLLALIAGLVLLSAAGSLLLWRQLRLRALTRSHA